MRLAYSLYSLHKQASKKDMCEILDIKPEVLSTDYEAIYKYSFSGMTIFCRYMEDEKREEHLKGFLGYIRSIYIRCNVNPKFTPKLKNKIISSITVAGIEVEGAQLDEEILTEFMGKMCNRFKPIIFHNGSLFNFDSKLILSPDGQFNENVEI